MKRSKEHIAPYPWGKDCLGWHLVNEPTLSVIQESMPPHTEEVAHKHEKSQQFFYILKGEATFEIEGTVHTIRKHEGIHIQKNQVHQIKNKSEAELEFLVISQPHAQKDRINTNR